MRALLLAAAVLAFPAGAQVLAVNAGAIEVVGLPPSHLGVYPYVGLSRTFTFGSLSLVPSASVEWSPDAGHWGLVGVLTLDYALSGSVGLDLNLGLIHDQAGFDTATARFYAGAGPGVSFFLGRWTVSIFTSAYYGLNDGGWSVVPGFNVAYAIAGFE